MEVYCEICKTKQLPDHCWCVIDIQKKIRYFECKVKCKPPTPIQYYEPSGTSTADMIEPFELDIVDECDDPRETVLVEDWIAKPPGGWIEWMKNLFGIKGYRYVKVKTS